MKRSYATYSSLAVALALALGGCSTWQHTSRQEKGTAVGATGGALVGAAVGGPVGAVVGAGVGGYAGHYETQPGGLASANGPLSRGEHGGNGMQSGNRYSQSPDEIRSVQQALNDQGYNVGAVDGVMGPNTEDALRQFQQARNLRQTGQPDPETLAALGVGNEGWNQASNQSSQYRSPNQASSRSNQASNQPNQRQYRASSQASNRDEDQGQAMSRGKVTGNNQGSDEIRSVHEIRSVQQALNDKGFNAGAVDGIMGPHTRQALKQFQQAQHLRQTGRPDQQTLAALGVSNEATNQASNGSNQPANENQASDESNQGSNQASNEPSQSSQATNQGSNQASNPPSEEPNQGSNQASNLPGQASNQASNESNQSNETNQPNQANESNSMSSSSNQASNQQR
jgi:peptidoglycan hydrolase-like protein with peptidoglycan-binding domain